MPGIRGRHADGLLRGSEHCLALTPEKTRKRKEKKYRCFVAESAGRLQQGAGGLHQGQAQQRVGGCGASVGGLPQRGEPQGGVPVPVDSESPLFLGHYKRKKDTT